MHKQTVIIYQSCIWLQQHDVTISWLCFRSALKESHVFGKSVKVTHLFLYASFVFAH